MGNRQWGRGREREDTPPSCCACHLPAGRREGQEGDGVRGEGGHRRGERGFEDPLRHAAHATSPRGAGRGKREGPKIGDLGEEKGRLRPGGKSCGDTGAGGIGRWSEIKA